MRNNIFPFGVLLLVNAVFGVDADEVSVSVMVGDSVTLRTDVTEIPRDSKIIWKFGNEIIAKMNEADGGNPSTNDGPGAIFKDRLKLDKQTGSLTITNIRTEHAGHYSVDIKSTDAKLKTFQVTVRDDVESLSVMEGDNVTLHTNITNMQRDDQILWKLEDQVIPIAHLNGPDDAKWRNIRLNDTTRDLVISNIRSDQSGLYKVEINTISMVLHRKFHIAVGAGLKTISVKEGEIIILHTGVTEINGYDLILWTTGDDIVGEINKKTKTYHRDEKRFEGRLQLHPQTGYLIISNSKTTDHGLYHLNMKSISHTLQRNISVTVSGPPQSGAVSGICGAGVGLVIWAAFFAARFVDNQGKGVLVSMK